MTDRRSFFKSLALLGAAAVGCPGVFIPKFEPVKWKKTIVTKPFIFDQRDFIGTWKWVGPLVIPTLPRTETIGEIQLRVESAIETSELVGAWFHVSQD